MALHHAYANSSPTDLVMLIKICGLSTPETLAAALDAGADQVGLNFHPKSPRYVSQAQAVALADQARGKTGIVALIVDYDEKQALDMVRFLKPDWLQLHGAETPALVAATATAAGIPVMKALGISEAADVATVMPYASIADMILLDAKPPKDAAYPGGHGKPFDWNILGNLDPALPFMLSGGLTPDNVAEAITTVRALGVNLIGIDVSSGVESAPGVKDSGKIRAFIQAARSAG